MKKQSQEEENAALGSFSGRDCGLGLSSGVRMGFSMKKQGQEEDNTALGAFPDATAVWSMSSATMN